MANTVSSLTKIKVISPNTDGRRCYKVTRITPHCMVGQMTARSCGNLFTKTSYAASSNYGIGKDGEVGLYLDESMRSWCSSSADNDNRAITIECASDARHPYAFNDKVWKSLIALCVDICARYGKDTLIWFGDKDTTLKYQPKDNEMVLTAHRWFAAKACPGDWLYNRLGRLANEVNTRLKALAENDPAPSDKAVEDPNTAAAALINNEEETREKKIWKFLSGKGLNAYAVAGIMGNLYSESALRPNNLQNSFEKKLKMSDKGYTNAVNDGSYKNFVHDGAGYGLAQWTWHARKKNLLDFAKTRAASIDDMDMQLDFLWQELQGYGHVMQVLRSAKTVRAASDVILTEFEKPADQSSAVKKRRMEFGQGYYKKYAKAKEKPATGQNEPSDAPKTTTVYCVQIGAFNSVTNANARADSVREKGFEASVTETDGCYRVQFGEFESASVAQAAAAKVRKAGYKAIIKAVTKEA